MIIKQRSLLCPRNVPRKALMKFGELQVVSSSTVNLLFLLYSMVMNFSLLYLIRQRCLLNSFPNTLILMIELVLCFFSRIDLKLCNSFVILEIIIEVIAALRCFILFVFQCYFWRVVLKKSHLYLLIFPTYVWLNLVLWKLYSVAPNFV